MKEAILKKLELLVGQERFSEVKDELLRLGEILSDTSKQISFQIYPITFSIQHNFNLVFLLDALVFGTQIELFEISFRQICPGCGGAEYTVPSLDKISVQGHHCTICDVKVDVVLDEQVEVVFCLSRDFREGNQDVYESAETFRSHFFSPHLERSSQLLRYSKERLVCVEMLPPKASTKISFQPGLDARLYRLLSVKNHSQVLLSVVKEKGSEQIYVEVTDTGFSMTSGLISQKPVTLCVTNQTSETYPLTVLKTDFDLLHKILKETPNIMCPFFSAKDLINLQTFRENFKFDTLSSDFCLPIRNMTVLFTDIKGSAQLYENRGDRIAYQMVRDHLKILTEHTRNHMGCIVKTLGDSVMATFSNPKDAILAALAMIETCTLTQTGTSNIDGLKIGIHSGEVLVVNAESRLDFFGQTINLASRLKDQAQSGEICMTPRVLEWQGVKQLIAENKWQTESIQKKIKGFNEPIKFERVFSFSDTSSKAA